MWFIEHKGELNFSLNRLYCSVEVSKQATWKAILRREQREQEIAALEEQVLAVRKAHGGCGLEKLYYRLQPKFIGRDRFVEIFQALGHGIKKRPNRARTTFRGHLRIHNYIEGMVVHFPDQLWQSDITYYRVGERFFYLIFIIDVYTKMILGYGAFDHMRSEANLSVLKQALKSRGNGPMLSLIHHSDHGSQYMAKTYLEHLKRHQILISMGDKAQENAYAERINRTIKEEYLDYKRISSLNQLKKELRIAVRDYNFHRPHKHLQMTTPVLFEQQLKQNSLDRYPIFLIQTQDGPDFRRRLKSISADLKIHNAFFCPIQANSMFYSKVVNRS